MLSKLAGVPSEHDCTTALQRFKRNGYDLDPHNPEHRAAYFIIRGSSGRPTGEMLVNWLNNSTTDTSVGVGSSYDCWVVPFENFPLPEGLPESLRSKVKTLESLEQLSLNTASQAIHFASNYILDGSAERSTLGMNVWTVKFFSNSTARCNTTRFRSFAVAGQPQAALSWPATGGVAGTPPQRGVKRNRSDGSPSGFRSPPVRSVGDPHQSRVDRLQGALKTVLKEMNQAVRAGRFISASQWSKKNSAACLKDELISLLKTSYITVEHLCGLCTEQVDRCRRSSLKSQCTCTSTFSRVFSILAGFVDAVWFCERRSPFGTLR